MMHKQKKVLVIDDDPGILEAIQFILTDAGYEVITNDDADKVYELVYSEHPNVVLLDVMLSGMDGRDICRRLKSDPETNKLPVIMFTAMTADKDMISSCGSEDFIAKPFDVDELIGKVEMYS